MNSRKLPSPLLIVTSAGAIRAPKTKLMKMTKMTTLTHFQFQLRVVAPSLVLLSVQKLLVSGTKRVRSNLASSLNQKLQKRPSVKS